MRFEDWRRDQFIEAVRRSIRQVTNNLIHAMERYDIDMWDEIFEYMRKKKSERDGIRDEMNIEEIIAEIENSNMESEAKAEIVELLEWGIQK